MIGSRAVRIVAAALILAMQAVQAAAEDPLTTCEETRNENGLRITIFAPSAKGVRLGVFDRSGKEIDKELIPASAPVAFARVVWGLKTFSPEKMLKGGYLIAQLEPGRSMEGIIFGYDGAGAMISHRAYLTRTDDEPRRWRLSLGADRQFTCRDVRGTVAEPKAAPAPAGKSERTEPKAAATTGKAERAERSEPKSAAPAKAGAAASAAAAVPPGKVDGSKAEGGKARTPVPRSTAALKSGEPSSAGETAPAAAADAKRSAKASGEPKGESGGNDSAAKGKAPVAKAATAKAQSAKAATEGGPGQASAAKGELDKAEKRPQATVGGKAPVSKRTAQQVESKRPAPVVDGQPKTAPVQKRENDEVLRSGP